MSGWAIVADQKSEAGVWVIADAAGEELHQGLGLASLVEKLEVNLVLFAAIRVMGVDEQENVTSSRPKIVRINWVGEKVPAMKKMGALSGKATIAEKWNGTAIEKDCTKTEEVSMQGVGTSLLSCGGAHKPTHYEFGNGDKIPLSECVNKA